ncbi:RNHCP domain-containing protein [Candidatus Falkowbacteria bacterium]|nr:MAG: RNHCP domain-containing protein [Candidatus Falkowbacteria bacterium]
MSQAFKRTIENFICEHCQQEVVGNGYTNHCPHCLYSKHVDINPGDREATCGGLMKPMQIEIKGQEWIILHTCLICGFKKKNKVSPGDNREAIIQLAKS